MKKPIPPLQVLYRNTDEEKTHNKNWSTEVNSAEQFFKLVFQYQFITFCIPTHICRKKMYSFEFQAGFDKFKINYFGI